MIVPEFIKFYGYKLDYVFNMAAITFFTLANSMYRLKADERLDGIMEVAAGFAGKEAASVIDNLEKQSRGAHGIVEEAKIIKRLRK